METISRSDSDKSKQSWFSAEKVLHYGQLFIYLCVLYAIFAAFFVMLLEIAGAVRKTDWLVFSKYDGPNEQEPYPWVTAKSSV